MIISISLNKILVCLNLLAIFVSVLIPLSFISRLNQKKESLHFAGQTSNGVVTGFLISGIFSSLRVRISFCPSIFLKQRKIIKIETYVDILCVQLFTIISNVLNYFVLKNKNKKQIQIEIQIKISVGSF